MSALDVMVEVEVERATRSLEVERDALRARVAELEGRKALDSELVASIEVDRWKLWQDGCRLRDHLAELEARSDLDTLRAILKRAEIDDVIESDEEGQHWVTMQADGFFDTRCLLFGPDGMVVPED